MSVRLMSLVFSCNMPELKTDDGKTVPDTTAKFVLLALADNANDEGEGSYPGVDTLCKKTNYSTATVCNALNALRHNGFTRLEGKSKYDTNNYTVLATKIIEFQWLKQDDFSGYNPPVLAAKTNPSVKPSVKPIDIKDPISAKIEELKFSFNPNTSTILKIWADDWPGQENVIIRALEMSRGKSIMYADKILIGWKRDGVPPTREELLLQKGNSNARPQRNAAPDNGINLEVSPELEALGRKILAQRAAQNANV